MPEVVPIQSPKRKLMLVLLMRGKGLVPASPGLEPELREGPGQVPVPSLVRVTDPR